MKQKFVLTLLILTAIMANAQNPFFKPFDTKYQTPPFSQFNNSQWIEAVDFGINKANENIKAITSQKEAPTFENTIVALEKSDSDLNRVLGVFFNLLEANSDDEMMQQSIEISAKSSDYSTSIILNEDLWKRVKTVYDNRKDLHLAAEDSMLLQKTYDSFAQSGANLVGADRDKFKQLRGELSQLTTQFGRNVQKELPTHKMYLTKDDLTGLPESQVEAAALAAEQDGHKGEYLITLDAPVYIAFMKYSDRRDLREKLYRMYNGRNITGEYSNVDIIKRIVEVRREIANLLGKATYADQTLVNTMAQKPENVYNLLNNLRDAYAPAAKKEMAELTEYASKFEGKPIEIMPWDYSYYSNKHRADKYSFDEEAMRPYFELNNVIDGVFGLATRLYGLHFKADPEIEVYHPDVTAYVVTDNDGKYLGVLYTDFFPRASKRPGAWMTNFKEQWIEDDGTDSRPHVSIVMNFTKPVGDKPSLLTPYEIETFLHEFGHSLHGLLANGKYQSLSGTNVYRDFVELPSQFNENYLTEREYLDTFAKHYITGEPLPEELVNGLVASAQYGAAYSCMRQLQFGYLDMAWHTITAPVDDPIAFEKEAVKDVQMFAPVDGTMTSAQFSHIFSGGYAAGYYSYKWAEVLDADAFAQFKKNGIFDAETAKSFRENVLMKGGTENPADLYRRFRGGDATIDALLIRDGIKKDDTKKPKVDALKEIPKRNKK